MRLSSVLWLQGRPLLHSYCSLCLGASRTACRARSLPPCGATPLLSNLAPIRQWITFDIQWRRLCEEGPGVTKEGERELA